MEAASDRGLSVAMHRCVDRLRSPGVFIESVSCWPDPLLIAFHLGRADRPIQSKEGLGLIGCSDYRSVLSGGMNGSIRTGCSGPGMRRDPGDKHADRAAGLVVAAIIPTWGR